MNTPEKPALPSSVRLQVHQLVRFLIVACLIIAACLNSQSQVQAQSSTARDKGISLFKQGDAKGAIEELRRAVDENKDDAIAWHHLGAALNRERKPRDARKAYERAIKLRPDYADPHVGLAYTFFLEGKLSDAGRESQTALALEPESYEARYILGAIELQRGQYLKALEQAEAGLKINGEYAPALLLKSRSLVALTVPNKPTATDENTDIDDRSIKREVNAARFKNAAQSLEAYIRLSANTANAELREELKTLQFYADVYGKPIDADAPAYSLSDVTTKARITHHPEPEYTEQARQARVKGKVTLRAVLSADGTIQNIIVTKPLSHGLTEAAVRAARQIRFVPATKDGRAVSQYVSMTLSFDIY